MQHLVRKVEQCFAVISPLCLADSSWDNVGVLVESPLLTGPNVLLTNDFTPLVLEEAVRQKAGVVVSYHPSWIKPFKTFTLEGYSALLCNCIAKGVSVFSPHTVMLFAI